MKGVFYVRNKCLLVAATLVVMTIIPNLSQGQRRSQAKPATTPKADLMSILPQSDAVASIKVRELLVEALPKLLSENPSKLAEANTEIDKFKTNTGLDSRAFEQMALGMQYRYPRPGITKIDTIALARGTFKTATIVAAGRAAAPGKYREEKYRNATIYIFTLDQQIKIVGLPTLRIHELAVTVLETDLLALGSLQVVRAMIDQGKTRATGNAELIGLATQDPKALIGFAGRVTPALLSNLKLDNEGIAKDVSTIRQVYGRAGLTAKDFELFLAARTTDAASAKSLGETLESLKQLGSLFVGRLPPPRAGVARTALDNLSVTTEGNELRIRTSVAQSQVGLLIR
jgi:hypothetical protein